MKNMFWKRMTALACAGIMLASGTSWSTVSVKAAEDLGDTSIVNNSMKVNGNKGWEWSSSVSISGNLKIKNLTAHATSEIPENQTHRENNTGRASDCVDGDKSTYWHSNWTDNNNTPVYDDTKKEMTGRNDIIISLPQAETVAGVTYLPRQDIGNGFVRVLDVYVKRATGSDFELVQSDVELSYATRLPDVQEPQDGKDAWKQNEIYERELLFGEPIANVKEVKLVIKKAKGAAEHPRVENKNINAAEISVLKTKKVNVNEGPLYDAKERLKTANSLQEYGNRGSLYDVSGLLKEITDFLDASQGTYTDEQINEMLVKVPDVLPVTSENGTGVWVSDLPQNDWAYSKAGYQDNNCNVRKDISCEKAVLHTGGKQYKKGIGMHNAKSNEKDKGIIVISLKDGQTYKAFEAVVGNQNGKNWTHNANCKVYLSNNANYDTQGDTVAFEKELGCDAGETNHAEVFVNVSGYKYIKLETRATGDDIGTGHVNWAGAKLYTSLSKGWADYKELDKAIDEAEAKFAAESVEKKEWYEPESVKAFEEALAAAKTVNRNLFVDQQNTVSQAATHLNDVIAQMQLKAAVAPDESSDFTNATYTVTTDKGFNKPFKYNEKCTLTPPAVEEGKTFAGWKLGEDVIYQGTGNYEFYVTGNYSFTAIYETVTVEPKAILKDVIVTPGTKAGRSNIRFTAQIIVPQDKTLKEAGLMWGIDNAPSTRQIPAKQCNEQYQFSITIKNVPEGRSVHGYIYAYLNGVNEVLKSAERKAIAPFVM